MSRRPRARQDDVLSGGAAVRLLVYGLSIAALGLLSFAVGLGWPGELDLSAERLLEAQTMCLLTMSFSQLFHAFNFRSETGSLFRVGPFANSKLVGAFLGSGLLQLVVTFVPPARRFLDLGDVHGAKLFDALTLAVIMIAVGELTKLFARTQEFRDRNGTTN